MTDATPRIRLSAKALGQLPARVAAPRYQPRALRAGILHFGVGNFHRAHQAVYLDDLFNAGHELDWGVVGAGALERDKAGRAALAGQDWLTTVVEQNESGMSARVTAAMTDYLLPGDAAAIIERLADPAIRIVSLTITEGGYFLDPASGRFNPEHPDIKRDANQTAAPSTVFGLMLAGLTRRRREGTPPFTVMSCDNIPGNGHVAAEALAGLAKLIDPGLAGWISSEVACPNSMVDRITPATTERERRLLVEEFGIEDAWPVFCEPFRQWVLEDRFPAGRPRFEEAGATFVQDVAPYEVMKLRILNGGHAAIAYPAALMDIRLVHEAMAEPLIRAFLTKLEDEEIVPSVPPVPGTDLDRYVRVIESRFANPRIGDTIERLCQDGSNRQPKFIIPTIAARLKAGRGVTGLALASALWCRFCAGSSDSGKTIAYADPIAGRLRAQALAAIDRPAAFLEMSDLYAEAGRAPAFVADFSRWLRMLWGKGTRETLRRYVVARPGGTEERRSI